MSTHDFAVLAQFVLFGSIIFGGVILWCFTIMKAGYQLVQFLKGERPVAEEPKKTFKKREPGRAEAKPSDDSATPVDVSEREHAVPTATARVAESLTEESDAVDAYDEIMASERAVDASRAVPASPSGSLEDRLVTEFEAQQVTA